MAFYLNAKQTKIIGGLIVLGFVFLVWFLSSTQVSAPILSETPEQLAGLSPSPTPAGSPAPGKDLPSSIDSSSIFLKNFRRQESRDGKLLWEASGNNARYSPGEEQIEIEKGYLRFRSSTDGIIEIRSDQALLHLDTAALRAAKLTGNVEVIFDEKTTVKTSEARYQAAEHRIRASGLVEIFHPFAYIRGLGLEADTEKRSVTLKRKVESTLYPQQKKKVKNETAG